MSMTKADWLRSEIEKLESEKKVVKICDYQQSYPMCSNCEGGYSECLWAREDNVHNQALTSIITRYKEELKVLESK